MPSELDTLVDLISTHVQEIKTTYISKGVALPSIDDPDATSGLATDPSVARATDITIAAARRLIATLSIPGIAIQGVATGMYGSALLNVVVEANVTEALREAGPQGLHVRDLAPKVGMDPVKLGRVLRYLCAINHTYREVSPDVFTNNRMSIVLDTGKPFDEVKDRNPLRYVGSKGASSFVGHTTDELLKGAAVLSEVLLDPETAFSVDATGAAVIKASGFKGGNYFDWIEQPEEKKRFHRFGESMKNLNTVFPKELILSRYPWDTISKGGVIVDVGGGVGGNTLPLARAFSDLRFVIQDRPPVIADAKKHWNAVFPEAIESGLVKLQDHDFFEPQPIKEAAIYVLRFILHDWANTYATKILQQLRSAVGPNSKVVILDQVVPYTCPVEDETITGPIPKVFSGNMPIGGGMPYITDIQMLTANNAQERTVGEWKDLAKTGGFKVEYINPGPICAIVCVPA